MIKLKKRQFDVLFQLAKDPEILQIIEPVLKELQKISDFISLIFFNIIFRNCPDLEAEKG